MTARIDARTWIVGLGSLGIATGFALRVLIPNHMDPSIFLALGEDAPLQTAYAVDLLGEVTLRPDLGHDGKLFFAQANDPFYFDPQRHAAVLDHPIYRARRMFFPAVAGGFGWFPPGVVVWSMLVTNIAAMAIGGFLAAQLSLSWGLPAWFGLWVPLNIGLIFEMDIGGAGIIAYVCCLAATVALINGRIWAGAFLFAAAALSREVMLAYAAGVFVLIWRDQRRVAWQIIVAPVIALGVWEVYIRIRLAEVVSTTSGDLHLLSPPFVGFFEGGRWWFTDVEDLIVNVAVLSVAITFSVLAVKSRLPIAWGALPFVVLIIVAAPEIWREPFDFARALSPIFTAVPFVARTAGDGGSPLQFTDGIS